jgi:feruloyl esterase
MEAQRFPNDYDGVLAGAPANYYSHLVVGGMWAVLATSLEPESYIPASKIPMIGHAVLKACDAQDGVADGILSEPERCHFDPELLGCTKDNREDCLTPPQVTALNKVYGGPRDSPCL